MLVGDAPVAPQHQLAPTASSFSVYTARPDLTREVPEIGA
jgi:hypothetical protein